MIESLPIYQEEENINIPSILDIQTQITKRLQEETKQKELELEIKQEITKQKELDIKIKDMDIKIKELNIHSQKEITKQKELYIEQQELEIERQQIDMDQQELEIEQKKLEIKLIIKQQETKQLELEIEISELEAERFDFLYDNVLQNGQQQSEQYVLFEIINDIIIYSGNPDDNLSIYEELYPLYLNHNKQPIKYTQAMFVILLKTAFPDFHKRIDKNGERYTALICHKLK